MYMHTSFTHWNATRRDMGASMEGHRLRQKNVCQTLAHYGKTLKIGSKTVAGDRTISIPNQLIDLLKKCHKGYQAFKSETEDFVDLDLVIYNLKKT